MDVLFRSLEKLKDNYITLLIYVILTQKQIVVITVWNTRSSICMSTVDNMTLKNMLIKFLPGKLLQHSRKGRSQGKIEYRAYKDKKLCAIARFN